MNETIRLYREGGMWMAQSSNPRVLELFGTDRLPTPFSASKPASEVVGEIQRLNPDASVVVAES